MLVTFLAPERNDGEEEEEVEAGGGGHAGDGAVSTAAAAAVVTVVVEAEGASGSDVDGRLSLSSANNIQHRPLHPPHRLRKPSSG